MSDKKQAESYEFNLKIISVKMKMKFPCRMALEYQKQSITKEAPSTDQNKFIFNETIQLKGEGDGHSFEILASLYTQKGTKYTSGSMKLLSAELIRSKGERLVIPLTKCLDQDAFCQLLVEGVKDMRDSQLKMSRTSSKVITSPQRAEIVSPLPKRINSERYLIGETRSQANFQPLMGLASEDKPRETGPKSQVFKTFTKSPNSKFSNIKYATYNGNNLGNNIGNIKSEFPIEEANSHRTSFDEGEVYREGYLKLKQKYKKEGQLLKEQTRKRVALQANENTLRLQIMKIRVKSDQLQKQLAEKNEKIKTLSTQLTEFQKKDLDLAYVRQQCNSLDRKNKMQEDTINSLISDNDSLKKLMAEKQNLDEKTIGGLRQELQLAKNKVQQLKYQFQLQFKAKQSIILTKNNDIQLRNDTIERQKRLIKQLEEQSQARMFDFQRSLTAERNTLQLRIDDLNSKILSLQIQKDGVQQKNNLLEQQIQKLNATITALEFNKKVLTEQAAQTGVQVAELKAIRDKYNELVKEYRFLEEQFATVRKSLQSSLQNKQINLTDLLKQYQEGKERSEKIKTDQDQKIKALVAKQLQSEANTNVLKNTIQKSKRINDSLTKENSSLRQQNKQIREDYKSIQRKYITIQNEYSTFSHRFERQSNSSRTLLQKLKEEKSIAEKQIESLHDRCDKLVENVKEYQEKDGQWKIKQRHAEERIEKEVNKSKQSIAKYEAIIQDQKHIINQSMTNIDSLNAEARLLKKKINELELTAIRDREISEKLKHNLKLSEQKIFNFEQNIKVKLEDQKQNLQKISLLEERIGEKDHQIAKMKQKQIQQASKSNKQDQIVQLLNKEVSKLRKQNEELAIAFKTKEENEQRLRQELKKEKEEVVMEKIKTNKVQNDFEKFKQNISDIIRIQFTRILNTPSTTQKNTERLRQSQVSIARSQKSHRSKVGLDAANLSSNLLQKLHQTKSSLWKMVELNRFLKQENSRLLTHTQNETNKYQFAQLELHRDIQLLEDEMNNLMSDKETECQNYDQLLLDLNFRLKEKETQNQQLKAEIAQYEAIVNGLKTDFQANNDLNDKKVTSLKQAATELHERIEYLNLNVACLEDRNHELEEKTIEQETEIISGKQMLIKGEKTLIDLRESEQKLKISQESYKKELKILQEKHVELQMLCNSQKEGKEKYAAMLQEQEKKCQKLNDFVNGLIAQKQAAIKSELQKSQQNNQLENQLFQLGHQRDLLQQQNQTVKKKIQESKQECKLQLKNIKNLEKQLSEQKVKSARNTQKVKERESDLQIKKQYIKDIEEKYRELRDKNYKQIRELSNQLQDKSLIAITVSKELNDKIIKVETQSKKRWEEALELQAEIEQLTKQLYSERDRVEDLTIEVTKLKEQKNSLDEELVSRQFSLQQRSDDLKKMQQVINQLKLQIHNLQSQCDSQQRQFNHHIEELSNDYNYKLDETAKENMHNQNLLIQENKQLRAKSDVLEQQLLKVQLDQKAHEEEFKQKIASSEERLKKIEIQRMANIQLKNLQIKKLTDQSKVNNDKLREKETEVRKLTLQIEKYKIQETQLQARLAQSAQQAKNKEKVLEREIQGLKLKQKLALENKQKLLANLHGNEAQIRKLISQTVKKLIETCCKTDTEKVYAAMKGLESNVAMSFISKSSKE